MLNKLVIKGRLTKDPDSKILSNGKEVCNISIAVNPKPFKKGETQTAYYFDCVGWGKIAQAIGKYKKKGDEVTVVGSLIQDQWLTPEGERKTKFKILIEACDFGQNSRKRDKHDESNEGESSIGYDQPELFDDFRF